MIHVPRIPFRFYTRQVEILSFRREPVFRFQRVAVALIGLVASAASAQFSKPVLVAECMRLAEKSGVVVELGKARGSKEEHTRGELLTIPVLSTAHSRRADGAEFLDLSVDAFDPSAAVASGNALIKPSQQMGITFKNDKLSMWDPATKKEKIISFPAGFSAQGVVWYGEGTLIANGSNGSSKSIPSVALVNAVDATVKVDDLPYPIGDSAIGVVQEVQIDTESGTIYAAVRFFSGPYLDARSYYRIVRIMPSQAVRWSSVIRVAHMRIALQKGKLYAGVGETSTMALGSPPRSRRLSILRWNDDGSFQKLSSVDEVLEIIQFNLVSMDGEMALVVLVSEKINGIDEPRLAVMRGGNPWNFLSLRVIPFDTKRRLLLESLAVFRLKGDRSIVFVQQESASPSKDCPSSLMAVLVGSTDGPAKKVLR